MCVCMRRYLKGRQIKGRCCEVLSQPAKEEGRGSKEDPKEGGVCLEPVVPEAACKASKLREWNSMPDSPCRAGCA